MPEKSAWRSRQVVCGLLVGWGLALAVVLWTRPQPVIDIDINHGLTDCPWPWAVKDPNSVAEGEEPGSSMSTDVFTVLRAGDRILLAEPVERVRCTRAPLGPEITLMLQADARPLADEQPPPLDPEFVRDDTFEEGMTAYRLGRRVLRAFHAANPENLARLDAWYRRPHGDITGFDLGLWTQMGLVALEFGMGDRAHIYAWVHVSVTHEDDQTKHVCDPRPNAVGGPLPACTAPWFVPPPRDE